MTIGEVIQKLLELDPDQPLYVCDSEYEPEEAAGISQEIAQRETASGKSLPAQVWTIHS